MRKILLTTATLAVSGFALFSASPSQAANSAWCSNTPSAMSLDCAFQTQAQCQASVSGQGGTCERNFYGVREAQARFVVPARSWIATPDFRNDVTNDLSNRP